MLRTAPFPSVVTEENWQPSEVKLELPVIVIREEDERVIEEICVVVRVSEEVESSEKREEDATKPEIALEEKVTEPFPEQTRRGTEIVVVLEEDDKKEREERVRDPSVTCQRE